ncbi:hypothetical protein [Microcoleus sp. LEGE 07076]|uniref:hypothetical protein n=1 Tax=Microcoleus sp. LEGE 07076 TaxID=915322 RepID=UPI001880D8E1
MLAIRYCLLNAKLLACRINPRDTLVIASWHITWGCPLGCAAFPRYFYIRKLFDRITVPWQVRCICTELKSGCALFDDDSFDKSLDLLRYILINYLRSPGRSPARRF